ncbi:MAG: aspartate kinase [Proteobacteria bacterium]|nr:aspartate kinase [Pseudomonadota bacterium]
MKTIVKKFGGTSVGDVGRIKAVARLIDGYLKAHPEAQVVAVASAMSGETDRLIGLAKSCVSKPNPRELDSLVATGEQVSVALLAMALQDLGRPAKSFLAPQIGIHTDTSFTNAQILDIETTRLRTELDQGVIPVVAGFQGVDEEGNLTTLGRGGSDTTAVAVAAALRADACYIYTDVEGVYSADPRIVKNARRLSSISHEEMLELAGLGAKVLHPRSVDFAMRYAVPLVVLSTFNPGPGTWIVHEDKLMEKPFVSGITYRLDEAKVTLSRVPNVVVALPKLFEALACAQVFVDMITQIGVVSGRTSISFTVPDDSSERTLALVQRLAPELGAEGATLDRDIAKVSVIGAGMRTHTGVAAKMFSVLSGEGIEVGMISTSEIKISVLVSRKYCEVAVRALHDAFVHSSPEVAIPISVER